MNITDPGLILVTWSVCYRNMTRLNTFDNFFYKARFIKQRAYIILLATRYITISIKLWQIFALPYPPVYFGVLEC